MNAQKSIPNFGTSAYLKLLSLNSKPRDTEIRKRLEPSDSGYDYYRAMRRIAATLASGATAAELAAALQAIKPTKERVDATSAIERLGSWIGSRPVTSAIGCELQSVSPSGKFSVKFQPDFIMEVDGIETRIHIWNTLKPTPKLREALGVLELFVREDDLVRNAIVSLRTGELFVAQNTESTRQLAALIASDIEKRIERVSDDRYSGTSRDDRPGDRPAG